MITRSILQHEVDIINKRFGAGLEIDWSYGRPRFTRHGGSVNVGPRMHIRDAKNWLDGYYSACEWAQSRKEGM